MSTIDSNGDQKKRPVGQAALETQQLHERLKKIETREEIVTYEELSRLVGRDVQRSARGNLYTAIRWIERDDGRLIGCVPGKGVKWLTDHEALACTADSVRFIKRKSTKNVRRLGHIKFDGLSQEEKTQHTTMAAQLGAIRLFSERSARKTLEGPVKVHNNEPLPIDDVLRLFVMKKK